MISNLLGRGGIFWLNDPKLKRWDAKMPRFCVGRKNFHFQAWHACLPRQFIPAPKKSTTYEPEEYYLNGLVVVDSKAVFQKCHQRLPAGSYILIRAALQSVPQASSVLLIHAWITPRLRPSSFCLNKPDMIVEAFEPQMVFCRQRVKVLLIHANAHLMHSTSLLNRYYTQQTREV